MPLASYAGLARRLEGVSVKLTIVHMVSNFPDVEEVAAGLFFLRKTSPIFNSNV